MAKGERPCTQSRPPPASISCAVDVSYIRCNASSGRHGQAQPKNRSPKYHVPSTWKLCLQFLFQEKKKGVVGNAHRLQKLTWLALERQHQEFFFREGRSQGKRGGPQPDLCGQQEKAAKAGGHPGRPTPPCPGRQPRHSTAQCPAPPRWHPCWPAAQLACPGYKSQVPGEAELKACRRLKVIISQKISRVCCLITGRRQLVSEFYLLEITDLREII